MVHFYPADYTFAFAAAIFWGLYIIFGRQTRRIPGGQTVAWGMTFAALLVVPVGVYAESAKLLSPTLFPTVIVVALLSSSLPYSLEIFALKHFQPKRFSMLLSTEPALAAVAGAVLLGEKLQNYQYLGVILVTIASFFPFFPQEPDLPPSSSTRETHEKVSTTVRMLRLAACRQRVIHKVHGPDVVRKDWRCPLFPRLGLKLTSPTRKCRAALALRVLDRQ